MKRRICYILIAILLTTIWFFLTTTPLSLYVTAAHQQGVIPNLATDLTKGSEANEFEGEKYRGLSRLGSIPPRCEHKCGSCVPCDPVQIPTTADRLPAQYANYEPEGWKCKCGTSYFNP